MVSDLKRVDQRDEQKKPDGDHFEMQVFIFSIYVPIQLLQSTHYYQINHDQYVPFESWDLEGENAWRIV